MKSIAFSLETCEDKLLKNHFAPKQNYPVHLAQNLRGRDGKIPEPRY